MQRLKIKTNTNLKQGFSLVEMLVAIAIFMSIMTVAISSLISIINATKKAQSIKSTIDSVTFALENISRDMRIGSGYECSIDGVAFATKCIDGDGYNIGGKAVRYISGSSGHEIRYTFNGTEDVSKGVLTKTECPTDIYNCPIAVENTVDLISQDSNVNITDMTFYVIGADNEFAANMADKTQPRVIITASGLISAKGSAGTSFNLQTNISQRIRN